MNIHYFLLISVEKGEEKEEDEVQIKDRQVAPDGENEGEKE